MCGSNVRRALLSSTLLALAPAAFDANAADGSYFERVATLPVYLNLPEGTDPASETVSEIVAATPDGLMLVYTDSAGERLGLVDIREPAAPAPAGTIELGGEPTSVTVVGALALAGVNTSASFTEPSGHVAVVDLAAIFDLDAMAGRPTATRPASSISPALPRSRPRIPSPSSSTSTPTRSPP